MANVKISALPSWTGSSADLRWFVMNNSGETETFKFSGYSTPLRYGDGTNSVIPVYYSSSNNTGQRAFIFGGTNNTTSSNDTGILAGNNHSISTGDDYSVVIGGDNNDILATSSPQMTIIGGSNNSITTKHNGKGYGTTIVGSLGSTVGGASDSVANFGPGIYSSVSAENNSYFGVLIGTGNASGFPSKIRYGGDPNNGIEYSVLAGGIGNEIGGLGQHSFLGGGQFNLLQQRWSTILGGQNNSLIDTGGSIGTAYKNSSIIGGTNNTVKRTYSSAMIASTNSTQNTSEQYTTSGVTMISCVNSDITNTNHSVALGLSGRTVAGGVGTDNTTYVEKLYIYGNTRYESRTVNDPGTINIDIFNESHVEINATGGTYNLVITPTPSEIGTPELTLLINYVSSGATITFDNSGNVQWRWSSGTPSFTAGTRSIIKVAAWAGNDVWEVSRSMNMS